MKAAATVAPFFYVVPRLPVPPMRKLVAEWQPALETLSGSAQSKLRLSFAPVPAGPGPRLERLAS